MVLLAGIAAFTAGAFWVAKGAAIIATGVQPPILFEAAPALMAVAVFGLAWQVPRSLRRRTALGVSTAAFLAAMPVLLQLIVPVPESVAGAGMATANVLVLVGLALVGLYLRRHRRVVLPIVLAIATVPAVMAGGFLMMLLGERALEIPIVILGVGWTMVGASTARGRYSTA